MNILVIRTHRFGDILQLTPMLQGLKGKYPESTLTFLTSSDMVDLLSSNPSIDEIISFPEKEYRYYVRESPDSYHYVFNKMYNLISELRKRAFDIIINRQYEVGSLLAWLTGSSDIRGGTYSPEQGFFFDDNHSQQLYDTIRNNRKQNRRNLVDWAFRIAGLEAGCGTMSFPVPKMDRHESYNLLTTKLSDNDHPIAVQIGAARSFRQWGTENFSTIIKWLIETKKKEIVLLGTDDERDQAEEVCKRLNGKDKQIINLAGQTNLKLLGGVLERCQCLITGDTGTMHMAAAVGTPVIAIFYGTAYPWETGPYGTGHLILYADVTCAPCLNPDNCQFEHQCRKMITPYHVRKAFDIFEAVKKREIGSINWSEKGVHLYMSDVKPGSDQILKPINEIPRHGGILHLTHGNQTTINAKDATIHDYISIFEEYGAVLLNHYFSGDEEKLLFSFAEYLDQWIRFISSVKTDIPDSDMMPIISHQLVPAMRESSRAVQARDFATIADLIQIDFTIIIENLNELIVGVGQYQQEQGTVQ